MQQIYDKNTPESIQKLFNSIADSYDITNSFLSFGLHKRWNRSLVRHLGNPEILLDLCAGTGEISYLMMQLNKSLKKAVLLDFSKDMLLVAKHKSLKQSNKKVDISFIQADATKIPLADEQVDVITIAYGLRNIKEPKLCIKEAFRTLKPGKPFGILELTKPKFKVLQQFHALYLRFFLPLIGKCIATDKDAYKYLSKSIPEFLSPETVATMMREAGFEDVKIVEQTGGIATLIVGKKPMAIVL